jgi:multisubunit Na+/H+ antiporter MnhB subunit
MISDLDLLQADVTAIAGILIFLTIRTISATVPERRAEKRTIFSLAMLAVTALTSSATLVLFWSDDTISFFYAKIAFAIGLGFIIVTVGAFITKIRHTDYGQSGADLE